MAQIFILTVEIVIPIGAETNEENAEIETQSVTIKTKISYCST